MTKLTKLKKVGKPAHIKSKHQWWEVKCECGNILILPSNEIKRRKYCQKSCQSRQQEITRELNIVKKLTSNSHLYRYYKRYQSSAAARGKTFQLSIEDFKAFVTDSCAYCGIKSNRYNGIDRVDNLKGYEIDNCLTCCEQCNRMKLDYSLEEFLSKCIMIADKIKALNNKTHQRT